MTCRGLLSFGLLLGLLVSLDGGARAATQIVPVLGEPQSMVLSSDGARGYVSTSSALLVVDIQNRQILQQFPIGSGANIIGDIDETDSLVSLHSFNQIAVLDLSTGVRLPIATASSAQGTAIAGGFVYAPAFNSRDVVVAATDGSSSSSIIPVPGSTAGPTSIARSPDRQRMAVGDEILDAIHVIDTATMSVTTSLPAGFRPELLAMPSADRVVSLDTYSNIVAVHDVADPTAFPDLFLLDLPLGYVIDIELTPDGLGLYILFSVDPFLVGEPQSIEIILLDLVSGLEIDRIEVASNLAGNVYANDLVVTPDGASLMVLATARIFFVDAFGICSAVPGDADGNGVLDIVDITMSRRSLAGLPIE